ncbi:VanZ family protein [Pseudalkalibacillus decolorationis]|uniref:VanZ family protein n=1 Tax=Pseudalkalibacillus decolorationis TaxID=163879 RepID=UPI002147B88D|nr:VanZ family protein [Pseudalkalibacillus decolorationis]
MHWFNVDLIEVDKLQHFSLFTIVSFIFGLGILCLPHFRNTFYRLAAVGFSLTLIGIIEEYRQWFVPGRYTELYDALANISGVAVGLTILFVMYIIWRLLHRGKERTTLRITPMFLTTVVVIGASLFGLHFLSEEPNKKIAHSKPTHSINTTGVNSESNILSDRDGFIIKTSNGRIYKEAENISDQPHFRSTLMILK